MKQLLVTDDDAHHRSLISHYMTKECYQVLEAEDGRQAMTVLESQAVDLAILDVMMPEVDGYTLCEYMRKNYDIPIILLSGRDQLGDKELGYLKGTDDYVTKPYELPELLFRIKALFRRFSVSSSDLIRINGLIIDRTKYEVRLGDEIYILPLKEFELLAQLAEYPGRVFSRDTLIRLIWGPDYAGDERTIDVHIKRLRKRFPEAERGFTILTIRGVGYKLEVSGR